MMNAEIAKTEEKKKHVKLQFKKFPHFDLGRGSVSRTKPYNT